MRSENLQQNLIVTDKIYLTDSFMVIKLHNTMHLRMHYCCCVSQFNLIVFFLIFLNMKKFQKIKTT